MKIFRNIVVSKSFSLGGKTARSIGLFLCSNVTISGSLTPCNGRNSCYKPSDGL